MVSSNAQLDEDVHKPGVLRGAIKFGVLIGFALNAIVFGASSVSLAGDAGTLPSWFVGAFVACSVLLLLSMATYAWDLVRGGLGQPIRPRRSAAWMLVLVPLSIMLTSGLHAYYPFRADVLERFRELPVPTSIGDPLLGFNYAFTALAFAATFLAANAYYWGRRSPALLAMVVTANLLLIPNDNCRNSFNRLWIETIGASPLMFAPASIVLLIAVCGLSGMRPSSSLTIAGLICLAVWLTGIGHLTRFIW